MHFWEGQLKMTPQQKLFVLNKIDEHKDIVFGKFSDSLTKKDKVHAWRLIHAACQSQDIFLNREWNYIRDVFWANQKKGVMLKKKNVRSDSGEATEPRYTEVDHKVLEIMGNEAEDSVTMNYYSVVATSRTPSPSAGLDEESNDGSRQRPPDSPESEPERLRPASDEADTSRWQLLIRRKQLKRKQANADAAAAQKQRLQNLIHQDNILHRYEVEMAKQQVALGELRHNSGLAEEERRKTAHRAEEERKKIAFVKEEEKKKVAFDAEEERKRKTYEREEERKTIGFEREQKFLEEKRRIELNVLQRSYM